MTDTAAPSKGSNIFDALFRAGVYEADEKGHLVVSDYRPKKGPWGLAQQVVTSVEMPRKWVALLAISNKEEKASDALKRLTWRTPTLIYWPSCTKSVKAHGRAGKRIAKARSVIPGYMFASIVDRDLPGYDPFGIFKITPGIHGWLRDGKGYPLYVSEYDMATIKRIEDEENRAPEPKTAHRFRVKDKVRFTDDLLGHWPPGTVTKRLNDGRLSVEVPMLGRMVPVLVFPHQIEAV